MSSNVNQSAKYCQQRLDVRIILRVVRKTTSDALPLTHPQISNTPLFHHNIPKFSLNQSTMTNKPTIIFVHGAWHSPEFFSRTIALLEPLGYKCVALSMPAVRQNPRVTSLDEDISTLRAAVEKEFELGNDVAVHAHSWGGVATGCVRVCFF